jgi:hypothetical protein
MSRDILSRRNGKQNTTLPSSKQNACALGRIWADLLREDCAQVVGEERGTKHLSAGHPGGSSPPIGGGSGDKTGRGTETGPRQHSLGLFDSGSRAVAILSERNFTAKTRRARRRIALRILGAPFHFLRALRIFVVKLSPRLRVPSSSGIAPLQMENANPYCVSVSRKV